MSNLSVEKLNDLKRANKLTNRKIADLTDSSIATIDRLFSGANSNPNINLLKKLADVLNCTVDDFMDYGSTPQSDYYENRETAKLAQEILDNPDYKILFDATRDLKPDDLKAVIDIANRIKGNYNG